MNSPLVSIIIVNKNGGTVFRSLLDSLAKLTYPNYELIIVDNGSSDGTQKLAQVQNAVNLGFARANNQGFEAAKGKYLLLLNNDTLVDRELLTKLVHRMEKDGALGVVQPKIYLLDKPTHLDSVGSFLTITGFLQHWGYCEADGPAYNQEREIFSAKGACMFIRRAVVEKVGLFDSDFGSYFEESDFCWRVWLAGWKVLYYPDTHILHKVGFTSKLLNPVDVNFNSFKNRLCSLIKNLGITSLQILALHLALICGLGLYYLLKLQLSKSLMVWRAIGWNIFHLPSTLAKRQGVQSSRNLPDSKIFPLVLQPLDLHAMFSHFLRSEKDFT